MGNAQSSEGAGRVLRGTGTTSTTDDATHGTAGTPGAPGAPGASGAPAGVARAAHPPPRRRLSLTNLSGASYYPPAVAGVIDLPTLPPAPAQQQQQQQSSKPNALDNVTPTPSLPMAVPGARVAQQLVGDTPPLKPQQKQQQSTGDANRTARPFTDRANDSTSLIVGSEDRSVHDASGSSLNGPNDMSQVSQMSPTPVHHLRQQLQPQQPQNQQQLQHTDVSTATSPEQGASQATKRIVPSNNNVPQNETSSSGAGIPGVVKATTTTTASVSQSPFVYSHNPKQRQKQLQQLADDIPPEMWQEIKAGLRNSAKIHHDFGPKGLAPLSSRNAREGDVSILANFPGHNRKGVIPVILTWAKPAKSVYVTGTFTNWREKIRLTRSTNDFSTVVDMPPGNHKLKFIINNEWQCSEDLPIVPDQDGHMVNLISVLDEDGRYQQDGLDDLAREKDFFYNQAMEDLALPPPYVERYDNEIGQRGRMRSRIAYTDLDFVSEIPPYLLGKQPLPNEMPPLLPPQLTKVLLNPSSKDKAVQPNTDVLPTPPTVTLNHLYACSVRDGVMALGVTTRYRQKFITAIFYRPIFDQDELAPRTSVTVNSQQHQQTQEQHHEEQNDDHGENHIQQ